MRCWARTICEAAMSSMARVIFCVAWTLLMRRRSTRSWPLAMGSVLPCVEARLERLEHLAELGLLGQRAGRADLLQDLRGVDPQELQHLGLEAAHLGHRDVVHVAVGAGVDHHHLLLDRHRLVESLLQELGEAVSAV